MMTMQEVPCRMTPINPKAAEAKVSVEAKKKKSSLHWRRILSLGRIHPNATLEGKENTE